MIEIVKVVGDRARQRRVYHDVGKAHLGLGNFDTAIDYFVRDLKIAEDSIDKVRIRTACCHLANCYRNLGHYGEKYIERFYKFAKEEEEESWALFHDYQNIGTAFNTLEYPDMFILSFCYKDLLKLTEELKDTPEKGWAYKILGSYHLTLGECEKALVYFKQHLRISKKIGDRIEEGMAYGNLGTAYQLQNEFELARIFHELCHEIAKEAGNSAWVADSFFNVGRSLESLGQLDKAADFYKRCLSIYHDHRGRLKFEDQWKISVREVYQTEYASLWRLLLRQGKIIEALLSADQGRAQCLRDKLEWNYQLQTSQVETETINRVNAGVVPSTTIFIAVDYRDGYNVAFWWVLREGKEVEFRRRQISENTLLACSSGTFVNRFFCKPSQNHIHSSFDFYDNFIAPIQDLLIGKELIFVPEGLLCLAPFALFMDKNSKYLCEFFRIRVVPSLSFLTLSALCPSDYHRTAGALVVGDPYLDEIINHRYRRYFEPLPWALKEAEKIAKMVNTRPLVGKEATKDEILKQMSSVALVHFATHCSKDSVVFAPNRKRLFAKPRDEDYKITAKDVWTLQLRAKLVVLSACRNAFGEVTIEGALSIARAFLGAGARAVIASLWNIDDEATQELMTCFYQYLMEGKTVSEALNEAMKCLRKTEKFNEVNHWGTFLLFGDGDVILKELFKT